MSSLMDIPNSSPNISNRRVKEMVDAVASVETLSRLAEEHLAPQEKEELFKHTKLQVCNVADAVQQMSMIVDARAQTVTWEIKQYFAKISQAIESRKKELLAQVEDIRLSQMRVLDQQFIQLNLLHQEVANAEAIQYGRGESSAKLTELKPAELKSKLSSSQDFGILFSVDSESIVKTISSIGSVRMKMSNPNAEPHNCNTELVKASRSYQGIKLTSKFGSRGNSPGKFNRPWDVAVGTNIAVADKDNHCIQIFTLEGCLISSFGMLGTCEGQFNSPMGIATNGNGEIIVADCYNHRVQIFTVDGKFIRCIGKKGTGIGQFMYPNDVAMTKDGHIPVADYANDRIQVFDPEGNFLYKFGVPTPSGVCVTSEGNIIVTDNTNNCVRMFSAEGVPIRKFGGEGSGDGQFRCWTYCPLSATVDHSDCIYVTDPDNHRVQIFNKDGHYLNQFGGDNNFSPFGVAVSQKGHIIVADGGNNCVKIYQRAESAVLAIAPT